MTDRVELESAVMECEGDVVLLGLALADIFGERNDTEDGWCTFRITPAQVLAITHAAGQMHTAVRDLSKAFYGDDRQHF